MSLAEMPGFLLKIEVIHLLRINKALTPHSDLLIRARIRCLQACSIPLYSLLWGQCYSFELNSKRYDERFIYRLS